MRLSILWRIMELEEGVIRRGPRKKSCDSTKLIYILILGLDRKSYTLRKAQVYTSCLRVHCFLVFLWWVFIPLSPQKIRATQPAPMTVGKYFSIRESSMMVKWNDECILTLVLFLNLLQAWKGDWFGTRTLWFLFPHLHHSCSLAERWSRVR